MPLGEKELLERDAKRDIGAELLQSVQEMVRGAGVVVFSPVIAAREKSGLSQAKFADLLGVSVRTLQSWEQGRKQPSGAAPNFGFLIAPITDAVLCDPWRGRTIGCDYVWKPCQIFDFGLQ